MSACLLSRIAREGPFMAADLRILLSEDGADDQRLSTLVGYLRTELLHLDVIDVVQLRDRRAPANSRAFDAAAAGSLLVVVGKSAVGLRTVVLAIRGWLRRGDDVHRLVHLEIDGDVLELSSATAGEQQQLIDLFVSRHTTGVASHG
jgi:hypothetical protein